MPNEVPTSTRTLQAPKLESRMLTLSSLGDWDGGKFGGASMGSDGRKQGELQEGSSCLFMILKFISDFRSHHIDINKSAMKNWKIFCTLRVGVDQVVQSKVKALKDKSM